MGGLSLGSASERSSHGVKLTPAGEFRRSSQALLGQAELAAHRTRDAASA